MLLGSGQVRHERDRQRVPDGPTGVEKPATLAWGLGMHAHPGGNRAGAPWPRLRDQAGTTLAAGYANHARGPKPSPSRDPLGKLGGFRSGLQRSLLLLAGNCPLANLARPQLPETKVPIHISFVLQTGLDNPAAIDVFYIPNVAVAQVMQSNV